MNRIFQCVIGLSLLFSGVVYANDNTCGIPVDAQGDTIPVPTGDIPYFQMPNALCADDGEYTWDYSGTVKNATTAFSLQATIAQFSKSTAAGLGFHLFDFSFDDNGALFFSNSTYGGENQVMQAMVNSLDSVQSSATLQQFLVSATSIANASQQWKITSLNSVPRAPLYKGLVGQPGETYQLTGTGKTFLWRYNASGASTVEPYTYSFSVTMMDERGATMEGLGGGYVGPQLAPIPTSNGRPYNVEAEIAQPRLKVLNWSVSFQTVGAAAVGYRQAYQFSGNTGMLWNDFGPVDKAGALSSVNQPKLAGLIQSAIPANANSQLQMSASQFAEKNQQTGSSLYNGNWLPVQFTRGKYAGATLVFSTFWNKSVPNPADQTTDDKAWSVFGWCNFFSGLIPNEVTSSFSQLETLYPSNPGLPSVTDTATPPYKISLTKFVPAQFHPGFPWAQTVKIVIRANTPLRYALAAYADELAKSNTADDPTKDIKITVTAITPIAQNTLFTNELTQYYEGAAIPTIHGKNVGYAWIEHMV